MLQWGLSDFFRRSGRGRRFAVAILIMLVLSLWLVAASRAGDGPDASGGPSQPAMMSQSIESALASHEGELADDKARRLKLPAVREQIDALVRVNETQDTAHNQLMLNSAVRVVDLEDALQNNRLAAKKLSKRISEFQDRREAAEVLFQQTVDRIELVEKQVADIRNAPPTESNLKMAALTQRLLKVLKEKKRYREEELAAYDDFLDRLTSASAEKRAVGEKLLRLLEIQQKTALFARTDYYREISAEEISGALKELVKRILKVGQPKIWEALRAQIKMGGFAGWAAFFTVLAVILAVQGRARAALGRIESRRDDPNWHCRPFALSLVRRSLALIGLSALFGVYSSFRMSLLDLGLGRFIYQLFLVLLFTRWGIDTLDHASQSPASRRGAFAIRYLRHFFSFFPWAAAVVLLIVWLTGGGSLLAWLARDLVSLVILGWAIVFWIRMKAVSDDAEQAGEALPDPRWTALIRWWTYLVCGGSVLLNVAGFGNLSRHWGIAWFVTLGLALWGWVSLKAIDEWHRDHLEKMATVERSHALSSRDDLRWSLIQLSRVFCAVAILVCILLAWDNAGTLSDYLARFFSASLAIGSLKLSPSSIVLTAFILFLTRLAVQIGRSLLSEKILENRPLERGLKDSILTVSSYLAWGVGLLVALGVLGVDATSLAVVFGALSVGIGFGLQNIFNNFISGLILLFERPIQVGDIVEVGGLWAEVKKINVRATVVQTFDNAAVIIPNSEFISQQVTNWSFKDPRMRRNIEVGVAYGSDVDLVTSTLIDIADQTHGVYRKPKPEVLFMDHADSALIFRLRIWVHINDYWLIPSSIRYGIDRRFRELGIEIAFPQRDLHIRSMPETPAPPLPRNTAPTGGAPSEPE